MAEQGGTMKKLTEKQKIRLFQQYRSVNFQDSQRLEGLDAQRVTLAPEEALGRITAFRSLYES